MGGPGGLSVGRARGLSVGRARGVTLNWITLRVATVLLALAVAACGSTGATTPQTTTPTKAAAVTLPKAHPHVVEPAAGAVPKTSAAPQGIPSLPSNAPAPSGPASRTRAPAAGAPTDAQVRQALARFQAAVARYHLDRLNFSGVLLNVASLPPGPYQVSIASVYTDYGKPVACGGLLRVPELGVANKTLPCGTHVIFIYGHRAIRVPVIDRGPYIAGRRWDLTGATAEALHFPGLGPIYWRVG